MAVHAVPCNACERPVWFLAHERTGKAAPIEPQLTARGNIAVNLDAGTYRLIGKKEVYIGARYVSHFYRCPAAPSFRR